MYHLLQFQDLSRITQIDSPSISKIPLKMDRIAGLNLIGENRREPIQIFMENAIAFLTRVRYGVQG
jgi:hypothetical protein